MGRNDCDASRGLRTEGASEKPRPSAPLVPNATTIEAMREGRQGNLRQFESVGELLEDLQRTTDTAG